MLWKHNSRLRSIELIPCRKNSKFLELLSVFLCLQFSSWLVSLRMLAAFSAAAGFFMCPVSKSVFGMVVTWCKSHYISKNITKTNINTWNGEMTSESMSWCSIYNPRSFVFHKNDVETAPHPVPSSASMKSGTRMPPPPMPPEAATMRPREASKISAEEEEIGQSLQWFGNKKKVGSWCVFF